MPGRSENQNTQIADTYNAAADHFDLSPLSFWDRYGRQTIERLQLPLGGSVLDVGCGSGASAIPAAEAVGMSGHVVGIDLSENLLDLGRRKAAELGLHNIDFKIGDMADTGYPDDRFDGVVSVFSIFFVDDMEAQVAELWRMVRPGGKLAVTSWGPRLFEPAESAWWQAVKAERPDLYSTDNPWDRIVDPGSLGNLLVAGGTGKPDVVVEGGQQEFDTPEDWWTVVMGAGNRGTMDQMDAETAERVRATNLKWARSVNLRAIETNVIYAIAIKE